MKQIIFQLNRDFLKIYHQEAANLIDSDQEIEFIFGEHHIIGNAYLQYEMAIKKMLMLQLTNFS